MQEIKKEKLHSGAELVYVSLPHMPVACASIWFRAGARFDPKGKEGLAHFFEHLLGAKTKRHPSRNERLVALAEEGIEFYARTTFEAAFYYHFNPKKTLKESVDLLLEGLSESIIDSEDVENEKSAILDEESRNRLDSSQYLWRLSYAGLWPKSSLSSGFFGSEQSIASITVDDIKHFSKIYYQPNNAVFVIFGPEKEREGITKRLDGFSWGNKQGKAGFPAETFEDAQKVIVEPHKDSDRLWVSVGWRTTPESGIQGEVIADMVSGLFASGWISLLVNRLRIRENLSYWVDGDYANFSDTGYVSFSFSVEKGLLGKALRCVLEEVQRVKDGKISQETFSKIQLSFLSSLSRRYLDVYDIMHLYGFPALFDRPIVSADDYLKAVEKLKKEDIERFVRENMRQKNSSVAVVGDIAPKQEKEIQEMFAQFSA